MATMPHSTGHLPRTIHLGMMPTDRRAIEAQIEVLIDMLDQIDGDPDQEPDYEDHDDCDLGEPNRMLPTRPRYGVDQRPGPTNYKQAVRAYETNGDG